MMNPNTQLRRRKEAEARKELILEAAWESFLSKGIPGTTMNDIALLCNLAKGTLYLYFSSKEEIAFALLLRATKDLLTTLQGVLESEVAATEQIRRLAMEYYRFFTTTSSSIQLSPVCFFIT